jgi:hypothetical protein
MATIAGVRRSHILSIAAVLALASPGFAASTGSKDAAALENVVRTGDVVAVTRWSGPKVKGEVLTATPCVLVLRADGRTLAIPKGAVKTLRRHPPATNRSKSTLSAIERCGRLECTPGALAIIGLAGIFRAFEDAGTRPQVVYRAAPRADARTESSLAACSNRR